MAARALSSIGSGVIVDISPRTARVLLPLPMLLSSLIIYAIGSTDSVGLILLLNGLWGFLSGIIWPLTQTTTSLLGRDRSGTVMSIYFAVAFLGMTIGQYIYGVVPLDNAGVLRLSALFFLAASAPLSIASRYAPEAIAHARRATRKESIRLRADKTTLFILAAAFATGFSSGLLREFLYIYLGEVYNLTREDLASILAAAGIASFIFGLAVGPLADRFGVQHVLALVLAVGTMGGLLLGGTSLLMAFTGVVLLNTAVRSSLPLTRNAAFLGALASMVALSNTLNNIGQVVSPLIAGFLYEKAACTNMLGVLSCKGSPYLVASLLMLTVLAIYATLRKKLSQTKA